MREYYRQGQAEVVSISRNQNHQTYGPPFSRALYIHVCNGGIVSACKPVLPKLAHLQLIACLELQSKAGAHDAAGCGQTERQMERLNAVNLAGIYLYYIRLKDDFIEIMA